MTARSLAGRSRRRYIEGDRASLNIGVASITYCWDYGEMIGIVRDK